MIDEKTSGRLISALPGLAVLGLVLAIAHVFGLLAPFGRDWLSWLTISDLVAITWVMLPFAVIGLACGVLWRSTETPSQKTKREARDESFQKSIWSLILNIIAYVLLLGPPVVATVSMPSLLALDRFLPLLMFGHLWAVARLPLHYARSPNFSAIAVTAFGYLFLVGAMFTGYMRAEQIKSNDVFAKITLIGGEVLCQKMVYAGERGLLIYDASNAETTAIPADQVARMTRTKQC